MATGSSLNVVDTSTTYFTLPTGMRAVHIHIPGAAVEFAGLTVLAGSRDEAPGQHGLAHFVEHTIFKGTRRRSSGRIINRMEAVGGELNAYTAKEETVIYSAFPSGNLPRATELIADLVTNSLFPEVELEKERQVVADEIDSYLDTPADAIFDEFDEIIFNDNTLAHNILGTRDALAGFTSEICRNYLSHWYTPTNIVAFYSGSTPASRVQSIFTRHLSAIGGSTPIHTPTPPTLVPPAAHTRHIDSHQAHTVAGAIVPGLRSPERHSIALLTNILGGPGMNSLLNVALRERRGLVYSVDASTSFYSDCGAFTIYFGCDPDDTRRCMSLINGCLDEIASARFTERRLEAAKKQYLGQLILAGDNRENAILSAARATLLCGKAATPTQTVEAIQAVTLSDIKSTADALRHLTILTLGPDCPRLPLE